ncbi:MAG: sugar phosphate isomerase/epimerase [Planctomycetia bacterium]|nr:sugar phosphate isomerase/epimerase [Planctomycetia bacterium]
MPTLSINEVTTFRWTFDEDVVRYAQAGVAAIGVWRRKLSDFGDPKGLELLAENNLKVSNLGWIGGFTGNDGRTFRESIDDAAEGIRLGAEMKAGCVVVYSGGRAGHTHNHARRLLRDAMKELCPVAEAEGIDLAIEPMHAGCGADWTFLYNIDDTLAAIDQVGSPRLKMVLDTYHLGFDPGLAARLAGLVPRIAVVHLGDGRAPPDGDQDRCPLGQGCIPLKEIVSALASAGYDGYYDVELIGQEIEAMDYAKLVEESKRALAELLPA